jgi:hypothetical protein
MRHPCIFSPPLCVLRRVSVSIIFAVSKKKKENVPLFLRIVKVLINASASSKHNTVNVEHEKGYHERYMA